MFHLCAKNLFSLTEVGEVMWGGMEGKEKQGKMGCPELVFIKPVPAKRLV
jgi:hypothetical protein